MADIYDQILDSSPEYTAQPESAKPEGSVYDEILDTRVQSEKAGQRATLDRALKVLPDKAASIQSLSKDTGLAPDLVERNFDEVKRQNDVKRLQSVLRDSPVLARQFSDPDFASLAYDDLSTFTTTEREKRGIYDVLRAPSGPAPSFGSYINGLGMSFVTGLESARQGLNMQYHDLFGQEDLSRQARRAYSGAQMRNTLATPQFESATAQGIYGGLSSVLQMAPGFAGSLATGNPALALGSIGVLTQASSYAKYRQRGGSGGEALLGSALEGGIEVGTELLPVKFLLDRFGKSGLSEFVAGLALREVLPEQAATIGQNLVDTMIANPDKTLGDFASELPGDMYQTLVGTLVAGGVMTGANAVASRGYQKQADAKNANAVGDFLKRITDISKASKVRERSPASFERFVEDSMQDGPVQDVYIDANTLMQSGLADQVAAVSPSVKEQLESAVQSGGLIRIPVSEYAANIAPTDYAQPLLDHLKTDPEGMSRVEAQEYMQSAQEQLQQDLDRTLEEQQADDGFRASLTVVRDNIKAQLDTAQRFTPEVNDAYATLHESWYAQNATRLGITPEELYKRYPLQIQAQSVSSNQQFDQDGRLATDTPAFRDWFGESKVVDGTGAPTVVYHGTASDFTTFSDEYSGEGNGRMDWGEGFYFTDNAEAANSYAEGQGGNVMPVYLSIRNPAPLDVVQNVMDQPGAEMDVNFVRDALQQQGYDGIVVDHGADGREIIAFDPTQIKSAIGNSGAFDANDPNILRQDQQPRLMAVHNLSAENLIFADEMGGLAVPSVGVVTEDSGSVEGFGEITLIGTQPLVDPANERVFSSDAYSARFPRPEYNAVKTKTADKITDSIAAIAKEFGDISIVYESFDYMANKADAARVIEIWMRSPATQAKFLREQGIEVQPVMIAPRTEMSLTLEQLAPLEPLYKVVREQENSSQYDTPERQQLDDMLEDMIRARMDAAGKRSALVESVVATVRERSLEYMARDLRALRGGPVVDQSETRTQVREQLVQSNNELAFKKWVDDQILPHFGRPFLRVGRKKVPYTLANIVDSMTDTKVRGKEQTMAYGPGQVRAATSVEFSDLEQMRQAAKDQIVDADAFEVARKDSEKQLEAYRDAVAPFTTFKNWRGEPDVWEAMDSAMRAIAKWATKKKRDAAGFKAALRAEGFDVAAIDAAPDDIIAQGMKAGQALLSAPVPYFEAKPQRSVDLSEFAGAVIPENTPQPVRDVLAKHGIPVTEYAGEENRSKAVRDYAHQLQDQGAGTLFQNQAAPRGAFNPATNTISLLKAADLSTFLHESGHFFLEAQLDMAAKLAHEVNMFGRSSLSEGELQVLDDANALLQWFGVTDFATWHNLDFEEKRSYHERFARGFEAYLFEGNSPSIEIQGIFRRFSTWLKNIYSKITALNVELTPEVRSVMDRMLASDDQIRTAEYARSMMPLFESAEQAGMTPEEFAAYQALGRDATEEAQTQLNERGMRDMKWMQGARSRALKKLQKQADAQRQRERIEARREVMSQPVYRAWQFLTGKVDPATTGSRRPAAKSNPNVLDPGKDSLFVAMAKLGGINKQAAIDEWGLDPAEKIAMPVFGKPVLRRDGGRTIDGMREALAQQGYIMDDPTSPDWDPNELESKFFEELGGSAVYSSQFDFDQVMAPEGEQMQDLVERTAGRLSRADLRAEYGDTDDAVWKALDERRMVVNDGLNPDMVAELFGFTSGDEMIQALANAEPPNVEIEALTDQRMLERHGELASPEALARGADAAIHNEVRARAIATEHAALAAAVGPRQAAGTDSRGRQRTTALLPRAAREFAKAMINRLTIRNLRPGQYTAAESRAAKAADKAMRAGDLEQAAAEKRNQLVNNYAARETYSAMDEVESGVKYLNKFNNEGTRKNLDVDYVDQIDKILERFDLRPGQSLRSIDKRTSLAEWIEARSNEGTEPDIPPWLVAEASREHYKNLTLEQFRGLVDAVKQIEHLGRLKQTLLTAKDKRELDAIVNEMRDSINDNNRGRVVDNEKRNTFSSTVAHAMRGFMAAHRKLANLVREMDGFKDGGPVWTYIVEPMNEAGNKEASMRADATKKLYDLTRPIVADGKMGGKGRFFPTLGRSLNRGERLAIALNWGNEGNRQRLMDGRNWTEGQLQPVLASLTAKEWQFVQGVWDFFESYRPEIAAKERRVSGKEPDWIEPAAFTMTTAGGETMNMRGGYYPVKYDPNQSGEAGAHADAEQAKAMMRAAYTAATTRRSFTKSRAEAVKGRPLLLTFDGIYQGANEVIHDLAWHEWLIDANKLIRRLDDPIRSGYGAETVTAIKRTVEDIARGDQPAANAVERGLNHLRTGSTVVGLGWNLTTALLQPLGISQSMVRVGPVWVARGMREFFGNPTQIVAKANEVQDKSEFMRNRSRTMNREINEIQNRLTKSKTRMQTAIESSFFVLIQKLQTMVDYPTWLGAYEKAMADPANANEDGTVNESRAIALADQAVIDSQGEGQTKDLSQVQRGHPAFKLFTNFYSYFNTALNLAVDRTRGTDFKDPMQVARLAGDYLLIGVVPTLLGALLRDALKGGGDDDDDLVKTLAAEQIGFLMGLFVGVRELGNAAQMIAGVGNPAFGYTGPAGLRFFNEAYKFSVQVGQGEIDKALLKSTNNVAGLLFHYPAGQVNRAVEGVSALIEGKTMNPLAPLVGVPYSR